jgi:DNA mismatch endonuclease (patch repair protein)
MDVFSKRKRSEIMRAVHGTDTAPEKNLRSMLHRAGYRFRKNVKTLPGKPDVVLPKYKTVIFVHGCFWHQHEGCPESVIPWARRDYWEPKLQRNAERDRLNVEQLQQSGWRVYTVWECELRPRLFQNTIDKLISSLRWLRNDGQG